MRAKNGEQPKRERYNNKGRKRKARVRFQQVVHANGLPGKPRAGSLLNQRYYFALGIEPSTTYTLVHWAAGEAGYLQLEVPPWSPSFSLRLDGLNRERKVGQTVDKR